MNQGKRPGGLTALAVINFVFAALGVLGILGMIVLLVFFTSGAAEDNPDMEKVKASWEEIGYLWLYLILALSVVTNALLIVSGIGYLLLKRVLGRWCGNAYAIITIISSIIGGLQTPAEQGGGFNIMTIVGLIYPLLTLFLINTTFKEDLVS